MGAQSVQESFEPRLIISPDSETRINSAIEWISALSDHAELTLVAASRHAGDNIARTILSPGHARFGLTRITLNQMAARLAAQELASRRLAPSSRLAFAALTARSVHLLLAEDALEHFKPVATKPGFPIAIASTLEELRMNQTDLTEVEKLQRGGRDLSLIARRVEGDMFDAGICDRAAVFKIATDLLERSYPALHAGPLVLLDLPISSELEARLVEALARRARALLATAARGDHRTIRYLERALHCTGSDIERPRGHNSLSLLKRHLFQTTSSEESPLDDTVTLKSWPGESRESVEIARQIQAEAVTGTPFDKIAVFLRSPSEYVAHLEEAFRRAAIPVYFASGTRRPDPAGRALLALLACKSEGLSARRFSEYLSLAQVPDLGSSPTTTNGDGWMPPRHELVPTQLASELQEPNDLEDTGVPEQLDDLGTVAGTVRAPWRWERLLVDSAVIGSQQRWERRLSGLEQELRLRRAECADEDESRIASLDRDISDLMHLRDFAIPLIKRLAELPTKASWGEWLGQLSGLATAALRQPDQVLEILSELSPMSPVGPIELFEVQQVLTPRLRELSVPPPLRRYGCVFVGPAEAARGLSFEVVFVPGLAEKLFPRKLIEDPILLDSTRRQIKSTTLEIQSDRAAAEQLALRLAAGAAASRVHFSFPRVDVQQSRPRVPSFYGLEVLRAAVGKLPGFTELGRFAEADANARLGWPAPASAVQAIDEAEYDLALLGSLVDAEPETVSGTAHYLLGSNVYLARALRSRSRKWIRRWTAYDGLVEPDELALQALAAHRLEARSFSPTGLQHFAACPYRFLLQAIHRLQPREEPAPLEIIDPLTRGSLFHKVQYLTLSRLRERGLLPLTRKTLELGLAEVDQALAEVAVLYEEKLWPAIRKVWEDGINSIRADLHEWLRRRADADDGWVPHKFELSFGLAGREREDEDPSSVPDPVQIVGELRLRGSIDLVERHSSGKLRATDHKTGKARAQQGVIIGGGHHLQPVLYALACEKLLGEPVESGRLYYCTADGGYEERVVALDEYARGYAEIMTATLDEALVQGFLPAAPDDEACTWCDYLAVCGPNEERRIRGKPQDNLTPLKRLRELP